MILALVIVVLVLVPVCIYVYAENVRLSAENARLKDCETIIKSWGIEL